MNSRAMQSLLIPLNLLCVSAVHSQDANRIDPATTFVETQYKTAYKDYQQRGDNFHFHHWVGHFDDAVRHPVIVWLHGGALMMGIGNQPPQHLRDLAKSEGYVIVGVHYRNYPFKKLPGIVEDVKHCFDWIRVR
ncbi:MAG: alpha/beta hydrolase fold domain-containing protein, partial [Planctomycetota bacterium]|nr:alpha/beta hydrolase fold domain-containing protein [Planctomycetota bacterium]